MLVGQQHVREWPTFVRGTEMRRLWIAANPIPLSLICKAKCLIEARRITRHGMFLICKPKNLDKSLATKQDLPLGGSHIITAEVNFKHYPIAMLATAKQLFCWLACDLLAIGDVQQQSVVGYQLTGGRL